MNRSVVSLCALGGALFFCAGAAASADTPASLTSDPAAVALKDRMTKAYREVHTLHETFVQTRWRKGEEDAAVTDAAVELYYRKPDRYLLTVDYPAQKDRAAYRLVWAGRGREVRFYNSARNTFQVIRTDDNSTVRFAAVLCEPELALLLQKADPFADDGPGALAVYTSAFEQNLKLSTDVLKVRLRDARSVRTMRYQLDRKDHLIHGMGILIEPDPQSDGPFLRAVIAGGIDVRYTLVEANLKLTDEVFKFTPPADARRVTEPK